MLEPKYVAGSMPLLCKTCQSLDRIQADFLPQGHFQITEEVLIRTLAGCKFNIYVNVSVNIYVYIKYKNINKTQASL